MDNFIDQVLGLISPHICKRCGAVGATLCECCIFAISREKYQKCINCRTNIPIEIFRKNGNICTNCKVKLPFKKIFVFGERRGVLLDLVGDFKYNSERGSVKTIAKLLLQIVKIPNDVIITAIPTAASHIRTRGFDHAELLAKTFARERKIRFSSLLRRTTNQSQHDLKARERRILAKKMFVVKKNAKIPEKVLLIDDIWTTGATTTEAAKILKKSGAREIYLAIVARQVGEKWQKKSEKNPNS